MSYQNTDMLGKTKQIVELHDSLASSGFTAVNRPASKTNSKPTTSLRKLSESSKSKDDDSSKNRDAFMNEAEPGSLFAIAAELLAQGRMDELSKHLGFKYTPGNEKPTTPPNIVSSTPALDNSKNHSARQSATPLTTGPPTQLSQQIQTSISIPQLQGSIISANEPHPAHLPNNLSSRFNSSDTPTIHYDPGESLDLSKYPDVPPLRKIPDDILYRTSFLVAITDPDKATKITPRAVKEDYVGTMREVLFNIGGRAAEIDPRIVHRPQFRSTLGEYVFYAQGDRDMALQHGFEHEDDIFEYLDRLMGSGHYLNKEKFVTPWHEIEMKFVPRHRKQREPSSKMLMRIENAGGLEREKGKEKEKDGEEEGQKADTPSPVAEAFSTSLNPSTSLQRGKKRKRESMAVMYETNGPCTINLDSLINAVMRHPLLLPAEPATCREMIRDSPHQLIDSSLLYILAHGRMENDSLSECLWQMGIDVSPNVITHRKKKSLQMLTNYEMRKKEFDLYKRSMEKGE
jgi:hypothetical protein